MNNITKENILYNWIDTVNDIIDEVNVSVKDLSINGKDITITKSNGTTSTLNTQDTVYIAGTGISISSDIITNTGVTSINGSTGAVTGFTKSVNGTAADTNGNVTIPLDYLPLDGSGQMAEGASLKFARRPTQDIWVGTDGGLMLGSGSDGGYIKLRCKDDSTNPGGWMAVATNGTTTAHLIAYPDARLTFGGKNIVRTVNGTAADTAGNVTLNMSDAIGSAVASNGTSLTLPSGGTWLVWNLWGAGYTNYSYYEYGVSSSSAKTSTGWNRVGGTYSGGTTVYAKQRIYSTDSDGYISTDNYSVGGKLAAIRIS
jgi:hypothetical protein